MRLIKFSLHLSHTSKKFRACTLSVQGNIVIKDDDDLGDNFQLSPHDDVK